MKSSIKIKVRSTQIDVMGHVNNATFLEYMEWSREEWYKEAGVDFDSLKEKNLGTVIVNINIDYLKEVVQDEILKVTTKPKTRGNKSYTLIHEIFNEREQLVAEAEATSVIINLNSRESINLIPEIIDCF
ncbi:MAG: acyl-CoA thioesterase [Bacillota bacterium]